MRSPAGLNILSKSNYAQILSRNETPLVNAHSVAFLGNFPRQEFFFQRDVFGNYFIRAFLYFFYFLFAQKFIMGNIKPCLLECFCRACLVYMGAKDFPCAHIEQMYS